jgi:hypothetical protein
MANVGLILLAIGFVCAVVAAAWHQEVRGVNLGWAALAFYLASLLVGGLR